VSTAGMAAENSGGKRETGRERASMRRALFRLATPEIASPWARERTPSDPLLLP
jgi:hypothetical protein